MGIFDFFKKKPESVKNDNGHNILFDEDGRRLEGNKENGKKEGLWKKYFEDGKLLNESHYKHGKLDGTSKTYYENGELYGEDNYKNGIKNGICTRYSSTGKLTIEAIYKEGEILEDEIKEEEILKTKDEEIPEDQFNYNDENPFEVPDHNLKELFEEEYTFVKSIRKKLMNGTLKNEDMLNDYIFNEHKKYDFEVLIDKCNKYGEIRNYIGEFLNDLPDENIPGHEDIEQYHSAAARCAEILYESYLKGEYKNNKAEKYEIDNNLPAKETIFGQELFKRDVTGLKAYFKERKNMERLFNELTWAIRNGHSVQKYLIDCNLMDDKEIRMVAKTGFNDIASFLKDMLELNENAEMRKDYNACLQAVKILKEV